MLVGKFTPESLDALTDKQRQALDLLVRHKTSKEISRDLGISPHTVDQRIEAAKRKLGVKTRGDLANVYQKLLVLSGQPTHEESHVDAPVMFRDQPAADQSEQYPILEAPERDDSTEPEPGVTFLLIGPELFTGQFGIFLRVAAVLSIALLLATFALVGLSIFLEASKAHLP